MEQILHSIKDLGGAAFAVLVVSVTYILTERLLTKQFPKGSKYVNIRRVALATILFFGILLILMALPISGELRGQILSFAGIIISAALALSSTTLLGNALAAVMIRFVNHYHVGDFIRVEDYFGKVTYRGIFHTEIQTEDRNLQTIPNLYLATKPIKVIRPSGTILSGTVSLGYDVQRQKIEEALLNAGEAAGLLNPFVFVKSLGDFSVVYQVNGLLENVNSILSMRSKLNKAILDELHEAGIEIVSPSFMNQRNMTDTVFIPERSTKVDIEESSIEKIIFDKADFAERMAKEDLDLEELDEKIESLRMRVEDSGGDINLKHELEVYEEMREWMIKNGSKGHPKS